jgi:glutathione synthase
LLNVRNDSNDWYQFGTEQDIALGELDVILMRKDPPFDTEFVYATYILERAEDAGCLIVNKPQSLRDANEKLFTAWFAEHTPKTLVSRDAARLKAFYQSEGDVILKPLDGMGGASIFRLKPQDPNVSVIIETLTAHGTQYAMAQRYIPAIVDGDKRVLVVNGEPVPYCLARIPASGETRGNLAAGGRGEARPLSDADWAIARAVGPALKAKGLIFVGLDIIGDRLTEINVTSPTCIREIEAAFPVSITGMLFDQIEQLLASRQRAVEV